MDMKTLVTILIAILPSIILAQNKEGIITYEEMIKVQLNFKVDGIDMERIKSMMPTSNTQKKELIFTESQSIYRSVQKDENEENHTVETESDGMSIKVVRSSTKSELYTDHEKQITVENRDFLGRMFLIEGQNEGQKWKIGAENKEIAGYQCQQAILHKDSADVIAWFTPQIQISAGPAGYGNLPGLILELNIDDGQRIITAISVDFTNKFSSEIKPPKKGKAITRDEFDTIVKAKMKEMGEMRGGNAVFKVIERN